MGPVEGDRDTILNQVLPERHVVAAAQSRKVKQIVKPSILGTSSDSACLMLKWHRQVEQQVGAVVTPWIEIITGNAARMLNTCLEGNLKVSEEAL